MKRCMNESPTKMNYECRILQTKKNLREDHNYMYLCSLANRLNISKLYPLKPLSARRISGNTLQKRVFSQKLSTTISVFKFVFYIITKDSNKRIKIKETINNNLTMIQYYFEFQKIPTANKY